MQLTTGRHTLRRIHDRSQCGAHVVSRLLRRAGTGHDTVGDAFSAFDESQHDRVTHKDVAERRLEATARHRTQRLARGGPTRGARTHRTPHLPGQVRAHGCALQLSAPERETLAPPPVGDVGVAPLRTDGASSGPPGACSPR